MSEEENGFTFVDKRHMAEEPQAESEKETPPVAATETSAGSEDGSQEIDSDEHELPNVYDLIGYCISLLATEAWQKLGLLANPSTGEALADLAQAKTAIDAVADLLTRLETAPHELIPDPARRDMRTLLNDLRLNYVSRRGDDSVSRN